MKFGKIKIFIFLISILGIVFLAGCDEEDSATAELISIEIKPQNIIIPKGATGKYTAIAYYSDGFQMDITPLVVWKSSNPCVTSIQTGKLPGDTFFHALIDPETVLIEENDLCNKSQSDVDLVPHSSNGGFVQGIAVGETTI